VRQAQAAGLAVILLDVEGEYTHLHEPTDDARMKAGLRERGLAAGGVPAERMTVYHLLGREPANPDHPRLKPFGLQFAWLSPYTAMEILGLSEAQQERFLKAYDVTREVLRDLGVFPAKGDPQQERLALELDEFQRGYPRLKLSALMDVAAACLAQAERPPREGGKWKQLGEQGGEQAEEEPEKFRPRTPELATSEGRAAIRKRMQTVGVPGNAISWRALLGRLGRLSRLKVFDPPEGASRLLRYRDLLAPGTVSVIDLSDSGASELNNIVIADLLRGVQDAQDDAWQAYEQAKARGEPAKAPARALVVIEEAHEFLGAERIEKMPILFEQVARLAKRGRKRWLGLVFVTQLPQHLPRQVLSLVNSYIMHKITDPYVVGQLRRTVSGIDEGLWNRLPGLAPGQAIVALPHMTRPLLVALDPTGCKLRLVD
jgi:DNA helicase HerA-like ATPase